MSRTVHLHVGVAKTGTTYLQRLLFDNRRLLAEHGVLYPGAHRASHFHASLDLRGASFQGYAHPDVAGAWQRLAEEVNRHQGAALISHETLARSTPEAVRRAVASFDTADVRVVVTARDLARQLPAVWQERVKNRNRQKYPAYLRGVLGSGGTTELTGGFWTAQWIPHTVRRWADALGSDRVTIVTVPPRGADPEELWRRFATATDLPGLPYDLAVTRSNTSLGVVEAELLRRLNANVVGLAWPQYEQLIKRQFAELTLAGHGRSARIAVPPRWQDQVKALSGSAIEELRQSGVKVVGSLDDLVPRLAAHPQPELRARERDVSSLALRLLADYAVRPVPRPVSGVLATTLASVKRQLRRRARRWRR